MQITTAHLDIHVGISEAVNDAVSRAAAIAGLLGIALIHVLQSPDAFDEQWYLGVLFVLAIVGSGLLAAVLARTSDPRAWTAAGGLAGLILIGYILSRTSGLPWATNDIGEWTEPLGLISLVVEGLVLFLAIGVLATRPEPAAAEAARPLGAGDHHAAPPAQAARVTR